MVKKKTKLHMVNTHGYIASQTHIIQYTLVDLAPIAFSLLHHAILRSSVDNGTSF